MKFILIFIFMFIFSRLVAFFFFKKYCRIDEIVFSFCEIKFTEDNIPELVLMNHLKRRGLGKRLPTKSFPRQINQADIETEVPRHPKQIVIN